MVDESGFPSERSVVVVGKTTGTSWFDDPFVGGVEVVMVVRVMFVPLNGRLYIGFV